MDAMSVEDVRLEAEPDAGFSFDALPPELAPLFLERLAFPHLLSLRLCCQQLNMLSMGVTRLTLTRCEQLYLPLLRRFVGVQSLTLEEYEAHWIPRLACVLGVFPRLLRLCLVKAQAQATALQLQTDVPVLALVGALQAGACPSLYNLSLDERLGEEHAMLLAEAMAPDGGLLFATIQAHRAVDGAPPPHRPQPPPPPPPPPLPPPPTLPPPAPAVACTLTLSPSPWQAHEGVVRQMLARGAYVEAPLEEGETPLIVASYPASPAITALLLQHKAQVNARRNDGATALIMAAHRGNTETVELLLASRAEVAAAMHEAQP